jgi:hypothetical protein
MPLEPAGTVQTSSPSGSSSGTCWEAPTVWSSSSETLDTAPAPGWIGIGSFRLKHCPAAAKALAEAALKL